MKCGDVILTKILPPCIHSAIFIPRSESFFTKMGKYGLHLEMGKNTQRLCDFLCIRSHSKSMAESGRESRFPDLQYGALPRGLSCCYQPRKLLIPHVDNLSIQQS